MHRVLRSEGVRDGRGDLPMPRPVLKYVTVYRILAQEVLSIRSLSLTGIGGTCTCRLAAGGTVYLDVDGHGFLEAQVRGDEGGTCRLQFAAPLYDSRLAPVAFDAPGEAGQRARRIAITLEAPMLVVGRPIGATVRATTTGALLLKPTLGGSLPERLLVRPREGRAVPGVLRQARPGGLALVRLDQPIDLFAPEQRPDGIALD